LKKKHFYIGLLLLFFFSVLYPAGIPFFIFLGVILYTFTDEGKNLFDLKKWEETTLHFEKNPEKKDDTENEDEDEEYTEGKKKSKKGDRNNDDKNKNKNDRNEEDEEEYEYLDEDIYEDDEDWEYDDEYEEYEEEEKTKKENKNRKNNKNTKNNALFQSSNENSFILKNMNNNDNFSQNSPGFSPALLFVGLLGLIAVSIISDGFVSIPAGSTGVVFDRGRGVLDEPLKPGMHLKIPFWQEVEIFSTAKQSFTMDEESNRKSYKEVVKGRSSDLQDVFIDVTVTFKINGENAPYLLQEFKTEEVYKESIVYPAARSAVYDTIGQFKAAEIVSEKREEFTSKIKEDLSKVYRDNKIELEEVFVRKVSFSDEYRKVIEAKKVEEENIQIEAKKTEKAEEIKKRIILEAQAEAESIRLKGEALSNNPEVIQLQFVEKMAEDINWGILPDGAVPMINPENLQKK
jgi:regulator of protease activity HflC (stomatin/prohibitin superfamily)